MSQLISDPTKRFSDRAANYVRFRPRYPDELVDFLIGQCKLDTNSFIADIGSGTGIFAHMLLERGFSVTGIEPNASMRKSAESFLESYSAFSSQNGTAENTGILSESVDLITAAQAFHWFNSSKTRSEFARILQPGGWVALIWNQRDNSQPFQKSYEELLKKYAPEYDKVNHLNTTEKHVQDFLAPGDAKLYEFVNPQKLDIETLLGRMQSASYTPKFGTEGWDRLSEAVIELFDRYEENGKISFELKTRLFLGKLSP